MKKKSFFSSLIMLSFLFSCVGTYYKNIPDDISIDELSKKELTWFSQLLTIEGRIMIVRNLEVSRDSLFWNDQKNKSLKKLSIKEISEINYENSGSGFFTGMIRGTIIWAALGISVGLIWGDSEFFGGNRTGAAVYLGSLSALIGAGTGGIIGAILGDNYIYSINKGKISFSEIYKWRGSSRAAYKKVKLEKILFEDDYSLNVILEGKELWLIKSFLKGAPFSDNKNIQIHKMYYEKIINN